MKKTILSFIILSILVFSFLPVLGEEAKDLEVTLKEIFDKYNNLLLERNLEGSLQYMDKKANEEFEKFTEEDKMLMVEFGAFTVPAEYEVTKVEEKDDKAVMYILGKFNSFDEKLEEGTGEIKFVKEEDGWKIQEISVDVGDGTIGD